ncbi:MAG: PsbP-related protein [Hormoscilla sp.]
MIPQGNWICDGEPKNNDRAYNGTGPHEPEENSGGYCVICGLPREAMERSLVSKTIVSTPTTSGSSPTKNLGKTILSTDPGNKWQKILIALGVAIALGAAIWALVALISKKEDDIIALEVYSEPEQQLKIKYPEDWNPEKINRKNSILKETEVARFVGPAKGNKLAPEVTITIQEFSEQMSLEAYKNIALREIQDFSNYQVVSQGATELGNKPDAYKIVYEGENEGQNLQMMQLFALKGDRSAYIITYTAEASEYEDYLTEVEAMIDSFEIK